MGWPEAQLPLAQAILAVCNSPKSNSVAAAMEAARQDAEQGGSVTDDTERGLILARERGK